MMGLIFARNLKDAKRKVFKQSRLSGDTIKEAKRFKVTPSSLKSEEKGFKLFNVTLRKG